MDRELTPWFPPYAHSKPVRSGVYRTRTMSIKGYSFFNARTGLWGWQADSIAYAAYANNRNPDGATQLKSWQGLVKP